MSHALAVEAQGQDEDRKDCGMAEEILHVGGCSEFIWGRSGALYQIGHACFWHVGHAERLNLPMEGANSKT